MTHYYAVMGQPIAHSLSPLIHRLFALQTHRVIDYRRIHVESIAFEQRVWQFFNRQGNGLNITQPYKTRAFDLSQVLTPRCKRAKAANTLWMSAGVLHADNTDGVGFLRDISRYIDLRDQRVLVLGAGGAARGILGVILDQVPACVVVANRDIEKSRPLQADFQPLHCTTLDNINEPYDVIINATAAGLTRSMPAVPSTALLTHPFCYDLSYDRENSTPFIEWARSHGCDAVDGIGMLVEQAAEAFYQWEGIRPDSLPVLARLTEKKT